MKKIIISLFALAGVLTATATEVNDTTTMTTLSDIIAMESQNKQNYDYSERMQGIWSKNTFLNISYNKTKLSSDEFPSTTGLYSNEYDNKLGVGVQWGHTFNFHRKPLGSVLFIGLDYTWMDVNFNQYKESTAHENYTHGEQVLNLPWHNKKMTLDYGMSVGPSLTLYPFTSARSGGSDKIRLQFYFHVGYSVGGTMFKNIIEDGDKTNKYAWGHGLFTSFGGNLTWNFIGLGYELRNDNNITCKSVDKEYDTGKLKLKEKTGRLYLQFRF